MDHKHTNVGKKVVLKGWKSGLFVNFGRCPCSWIRIRIPNTAPDPREQTIRIRTYNTVRKYIIWIRKEPSRYLSRLLAGNAGLAEVDLLLADVAQSVLLRLHLLVDEFGEAGPNILHQAWGNKRNIITGRLDCH
jgi:hypothetical protein